jgi:hypothetical protein
MSHSVPKILSWVLSSQRRVFQDAMPEVDLDRLSGMRNEPLSFTLAYRADAEKAPNGRVPDLPIAVLVSSDTLPITVYKVLSVPFAASECEDAGAGAVGACPDILQKRIACPELVHLEGEVHLPYYERDERVLLNASAVMTQSLSITLNEAGEALASGAHEVLVRIVSLKSGEPLASHRLTVELIDALLPPCDLLYTNWVHYDCLADSSGLPLWSDAYFDLLGRYLKNAVLHGMNTLLTPAFTPALDTPVGTERMNVQLVGVREVDGGYAFDFSLLRRFVTLARACGITCFEHCHLFSQWGAGCAINIYGERNGVLTRLFGWDTPATDPAYVAFLQSYLRAFLDFADEMGIPDEGLLFHISDEPAEEHRENYAAAIAIVSEVLAGKRIGDALSSYEFYRNGLVRLPIVDMAFADDFDGKCDHMMLYYTGGEQQPGLSNRLLTNAPSRTRVLGLHLYRYNAEGFLHWGYNYTYGRLSQGLFDPASDPCFYKNIPGVTYLVYGGRAAEPMPSLREQHMREAINDYRALRLLESRIGREATLRLCSETLGEPINVFTLPKNDTVLLTLRDRIHRVLLEK